MFCLQCEKPVEKPKKFCNKSCFATHRNARLNPKRNYYCKGCSVLISYGWCRSKYCDNCRCNSSINKKYVDWSNVTLSQFKERFPNIYQMNGRIRTLSRQAYRKSYKPKYCAHCGYDKFYEVCHIKAIKDFSNDALITDINHPSNLIALCPNCHWEFDHNLLNLKLLSD